MHMQAKILCNEQAAPGIYKLVLHAPEMAREAKPGQFVNIKCSEGLSTLLRRPISICSADSENGTLLVYYQLKGAGTTVLSQIATGQTLDVMGPLGTGFSITDDTETVVAVGGGIGIFPLLFLMQKSNAKKKKVILGFRNASLILLTDEFIKTGAEVVVATDDGSAGHKGFVTELLKADLDTSEESVNSRKIIYSCGPTPMLKRVAEAALANSVRCQVSMEQRMGCGIGACLVCACKTKKAGEGGGELLSSEGWEYSHVCSDGPVFWSDEVIFDD